MKLCKALSIILLCVVGMLQGSSSFLESIHGSGGVFDSDPFFRKDVFSHSESLGEHAQQYNQDHHINPDDYYHEEYGATDQDVDMQHDPQWQAEHERDLQYLKRGGRDLSGLRLGQVDDGASEFEDKAIAQPSVAHQDHLFGSDGISMVHDILGDGSEPDDIDSPNFGKEQHSTGGINLGVVFRQEQQRNALDQKELGDLDTEDQEFDQSMEGSETDTIPHVVQQSMPEQEEREQEEMFPGVTSKGKFVHQADKTAFQKKDSSGYLDPDTQEDLNRHKITDKEKIGDKSFGRWRNLYHVGRAAKSLVNYVGMDRVKQGDVGLQDLQGTDLSAVEKTNLLKRGNYLAPQTEAALKALYKSRGKELPKKMVGEIVQTDTAKISQKDLDQAHALRQDALDNKEDLETYLKRFKDRFSETGKKRDDTTIFGTQRTRASLRIAQDIMKHHDEVPSVLVLDKLVKELKSLSFRSEIHRIKEILRELDKHPGSKAAEAVKKRLDTMLQGSKYHVVRKPIPEVPVAKDILDKRESMTTLPSISAQKNGKKGQHASVLNLPSIEDKSGYDEEGYRSLPQDDDESDLY